MRFTPIILLFLALSASGQERLQIPNYQEFGRATPTQASEMKKVLANYGAAWAQLDGEQLASLHSENTEWMNAYARILRGRAALEAFFSKRLFPEFARRLESQQISLQPVSIRYLSEQVSVTHLYTDFALQNQAPRRTHFHLVWHKSDDQWRVAHTAIMDPR